MTEKKEVPPGPGPWCLVDACPAFVCQGPHREVYTTRGMEILRFDQEPIGTPVEPPTTDRGEV